MSPVHWVDTRSLVRLADAVNPVALSTVLCRIFLRFEPRRYEHWTLRLASRTGLSRFLSRTLLQCLGLRTAARYMFPPSVYCKEPHSKDTAEMRFFAVRSPRLWVSGYITKWRIQGSFHSSYSRLLNVKTWPRNSILFLRFLNAFVAT